MEKKVYIVDAKRTAIGKFLGSLYGANPVEVAAQLIKKGFDSKLIEDCEELILGNVISAGMGQGLARAIAINSGMKQETTAYSVNMVCGSGMQAIINGYKDILLGRDLVLAGGIEIMSNIPFATSSSIRSGKKLGNFEMSDLMVADGLTDTFSKVHMGITAENIAKKYNITRDHQDDYAYLTQQRAIKAVDDNVFANEIVPITLLNQKKKEYTFDTDEFPNRESTREKMGSLKPSFDKEGTVTAANSSGINDGACFLMLASDEYCVNNNIKPLTEIVSYETAGCDPQYMGLGPYYSIKRLLDNNGVDFKDIDYFEINEAFAAQVLGCFKLLEEEYGIDEKYIIEHCNKYGSGLGLGHPLGCTGARITTTLVHEMNNNKGIKYGISSLCIGGGMGAALLLKRVD